MACEKCSFPKCEQEAKHHRKSVGRHVDQFWCCDHYNLVLELELEVLRRWHADCEKHTVELRGLMEQVLLKYGTV